MSQAFPFEPGEEIDHKGRARGAQSVHQARMAKALIQRFYERFQQEHLAFANCIQGSTSSSERERYASLLLNRLLFVYFLQKKGLLDHNTDFLRVKMSIVQTHVGQNAFLFFFRRLLSRLFHEHANIPEQYIDGLDALLGDVPFLAENLFIVHELNCSLAALSIPDNAFSRIFALFDSFHWDIDERVQAHRAAIHPDIISYLCEKYINQKQMGAYYTEEDVTTYISQNAIMAAIFHTLQQALPQAFTAKGPLWNFLQLHLNRYLPPALLSPERLPAETQHEYDCRNTRLAHISKALFSRPRLDYHDFVTYNLNARLFATDVILQSTDSTLVRAFYERIACMTILDPTCGSGAFLFAALDILAPLYAACLERMQMLLTNQPDKVCKEDRVYFQTIINQVNTYPRRACHILTSIVVNNLYGVDIMPEAVESCRLRLFLKLAASLKDSREIGVLSNIAFNIRPGNALIGHTSSDESEKALRAEQPPPLTSNALQAINQNMQEHHESQQFYAWPLHHKPFHWLLEFSTILQCGGFDVILGNPPYVEYSKVCREYTVPGYEKKSYGNLYAPVLERSLKSLLSEHGYLGMIVPISICSGERFKTLRETLKKHIAICWLANFEIFPCRLFSGPNQRLSIFLAEHASTPAPVYNVTGKQRWYARERPYLLGLISYTRVTYSIRFQDIPKLASPLQEHILHTITTRAHGTQLAHALLPHKTKHFVYYQEATNYWIKATCFVPYYKKNGEVMEPAHGRFLYLDTEQNARIVMLLLNSSLFYTWFSTYSDGFHLSHTLVKEFPVDEALYHLPELQTLALRLQQDIKSHTHLSTRNTHAHAGNSPAGHLIELEEYHISYSKPIIDEIDQALARHYGLTNEELNFIINYEIKYRLGSEGQRNES